MRILLFSDVHIQGDLSSLPLRAFLGKRFAGLFTLKVLLRERRFSRCAAKLASLVDLWRELGPDFTVFSGDISSMGFDAEFAEARSILQPLLASGKVCGVPGNHDIYTYGNQWDSSFETHFPEFLQCDMSPSTHTRIQGQFPYVRLLGDHLAVIGLNSARPSLNLMSSNGCLGRSQLRSLEHLGQHQQLKNRRLLILNHYGLWRPNGRPDNLLHRLTDHHLFRQVLERIPGRPILLHGHIHHPYWHTSNEQVISLNPGSATLEGRSGVMLLELPAAGGLKVQPIHLVGDPHPDGDRRSPTQYRWEPGPAKILEDVTIPSTLTAH